MTKQSLAHLMEEHRSIAEVLEILESICRLQDLRGVFLPDEFAAVMDFIQLVADELHHGKEEDILFPFLNRIGLPLGAGPLCTLHKERQMTRLDSEAGIPNADLPAPPAAAALLDEGSPLHAVIKEHRLARFYARRMRENRDFGAARSYIHLLREHIEKEDGCLFAMADPMLTPEDDRVLLQAFKAFEENPDRVRRVRCCKERIERIKMLLQTNPIQGEKI